MSHKLSAMWNWTEKYFQVCHKLNRNYKKIKRTLFSLHYIVGLAVCCWILWFMLYNQLNFSRKQTRQLNICWKSCKRDRVKCGCSVACCKHDRSSPSEACSEHYVLCVHYFLRVKCVQWTKFMADKVAEEVVMPTFYFFLLCSIKLYALNKSFWGDLCDTSNRD